MPANRRFVVMLTLALFASRCAISVGQAAQEPRGSDPQQVVTAPGYRGSTDGLRRMLDDAISAVNDGNGEKLAALVKEMEIPNYEEWFTKTFGPEKGESWAGPYGDELDENEQAMQELLKRIGIAKGEVMTRKVNDAPESGRGLEWGMLQALKQPTDVFFAAWKETQGPQKSGLHPIGYFFYISGGFRWDSTISFMSLTTSPQDAGAPALNDSLNQLARQPSSTPAPIDGPLAAKLNGFAMDTAGGVSRTRATRVLIIHSESCLLEPEFCTFADSALRTAIGQMVPQAQFIDQKDVIDLLMKHGLLAIDINNVDAVEVVAQEANAQVIVAESLRPSGKNYRLGSNLIDVVHSTKVDDFEVQVPKRNDNSNSLDRDPVTGANIFVMLPGTGQALFCVSNCELPAYTPEEKARRIQGLVNLLLTVREDGAPIDIYVLHGVDPAVDRRTVEVVQHWRFRAPTGPDGKPVRARISVQINPR